MSRFVLRYSGPGTMRTDQAVRSVTRAGGRVLDASGRMLLVECGSAAAQQLRTALPEWNIVAEKPAAARPRPPRPRLRRNGS